MIARFRALGWAAGLCAAAVGLYVIQLEVAAERGRVEIAEAQIVEATRDLRRLQTELAARGSLRQLGKWNAEVLALSTPKAAQFLESRVQLASLDGATIDAIAPPAVRMVSATAPAVVPAPKPAAPPTAAPADGLRYANYVTPTETRPAASPVRKAALTTTKPASMTKPASATPAPKSTPAVSKAKPSGLGNLSLAGLERAARAEANKQP